MLMETQPRLQDCQVLDLKRVLLPQGDITAVEGVRDIPFPIKRLFYIYDVPGGADRGGHAHYELHQLIVPLLGAFDVVIDDGMSRRTVRLERPYHALLVPPLIWSQLVNFSGGSICLVLASDVYSEADYIREYPAFRGVRESLRRSS
jgi:hypothetical protein